MVQAALSHVAAADSNEEVHTVQAWPAWALLCRLVLATCLPASSCRLLACLVAGVAGLPVTVGVLGDVCRAIEDQVGAWWKQPAWCFGPLGRLGFFAAL